MLRAVTAVGRLLRATVALTVLAGFTAGVPWLLASFTGWPLDWIGWPHPGNLPSGGDVLTAISTAWSDENLLALLATLGWLLWVLFCRDVVIEVIEAAATTAATRRGHPRPRESGRGPLRWTAAVLVGAIVGAVLVDTVRGVVQPGGAGAADAAARHPAIAAAPARANSLPAGYVLTQAGPRAAVSVPADPITRIPMADLNDGDPDVPGWARNAPGGIHQVVKDDNLWDIADAKLGDPYRWREIYVLNRGHRQANGHALTDPDVIHIGWILALPARNRQAPTLATPEHTGPAPHTPAPASPTPGSSTPASPSPTTPTPASPRPAGSATAEPDPDGVVPEPTAPTPSPANTTAPSTGTAGTPPSASPSSEPPANAPHADDGEGVSLPGGWVGLPLAATLLAAAALVWRRRRHRYQPRLVSGEPLDDQDLRPLPPVVGRLRHSVREQAPQLLDPPPAPRQPSVAEYAQADTEEWELPPVGPSGIDLAGLTDQLPAGGLGLTGPGAEPAARGLLVATLFTGGPTDPDARGQVVIPADALTTLLGAHTVQIGAIPRLTVAATLSDALTRVEELLIERRRQLQEYDAADLAELRAADPYHPPMPPVLLLAEAPRPELHTRLSSTLQLGTPLQISAVLLGEWPGGDTLTVHADGRTTAAEPQRLAVLDVATTVQLLNVLREAHTGERATPPQADAHGPASDLPAASPSTEETAPEPVDSQPAATTAPAAAESTTEEQHPTEPVAATGPSTETDAGDTTRSPQPRPRPRQPVRIRLLSEPAIFDRDGTATTGLRLHARELLVYLAVHRDGADLPQIMEAFWPTATLRRAGERLSTEVADLRGRIRKAAADGKIQPVINTGGRYVLNADLLDIDLWRMADALRRASKATDPAARIAALREAVDAHTGVLADGHDYDWIEQHREQVRRHGLRAGLHLANLLTEHDPTEAAALAQSAADLDPYNEEAARQAMRSLSRIGDTAGIRTRLLRLRDALDEIDEEPSGETTALATQLQRKISDSELGAGKNKSGDGLARDRELPTIDR
jgi:DNA-binding SARP family transcriptional activator